MNNTKNVWWAVGAVIVLALIGGLYYYETNKAEAPAPEVTTEEEGSAAQVVVTGQKVTVAPTISWKLESLPEDEETGAPMTKVSVVSSGQVREVGTFQGSCSVIDGENWKLGDGEVSGVICWFAGGGDEIGVFSENGVRTVKKGFIEEGTAETPGSRGPYQTVFAL